MHDHEERPGPRLAEDETRRFVFINGRKYVEGDTLDSGAQVERITRDGAILRHHGQMVVLRPRLNPYMRLGP